jgi:hypothetical protein
MTGNLRILAMLAAVALLFLAPTAAADPFLDAAGPPLANGLTPTSTFDGDLDELSGTLTLDDMIVAALEYIDGTMENLATGSDEILGANVYLKASFDEGRLTGTDSVLKIYDDDTTFLEGALYAAEIWPFTLGNDFEMLFTTGVTVDDPEVTTGVSDWIDELYNGIMAHGMSFVFSAHIPSNQDGRGPYDLQNTYGKLTPNPEPAGIALFGAAALTGAFALRRRKRKAA